MIWINCKINLKLIDGSENLPNLALRNLSWVVHIQKVVK